MNTMTRYLNLYYLLIAQSLIRELQYRGDWFFTNLNTLAWSFLRLFYYVVTFSVITNVGDWDYSRSLVLAGTFMIVHGIYKALFEKNIERIVSIIYTGDLDFIATKPVSSQFLISLRFVTLRALIRVVVGLGVTVYAIQIGNLNPNLLQISAYTFMLIIGVMMMYSISFIILTTAFWLGYVDPLAIVPQSIAGMSHIPFDIFPKPINNFITFVIPLMFITTIPARTLFEPQLSTILLGLFLSLLMLYASKTLWNQGLKSYSSASS